MPPEYAVGKPTGFCQVWKSDNVDQGSITDQQHPDNHRSPLIPSLAMNQAGAQVLILGFKDDGGCGFQPSFSDCLIKAFYLKWVIGQNIFSLFFVESYLVLTLC